MATKRYSFPTKSKAEELILKLTHVDNDLDFNEITVTTTTDGIACLGFQDVYQYNLDAGKNELVKKGVTYDLDVFWKGDSAWGWGKYEVTPNTPSHEFKTMI
jgi:hypothetical protein